MWCMLSGSVLSVGCAYWVWVGSVCLVGVGLWCVLSGCGFVVCA